MVAGLPTTGISKILQGNLATADAVCVERLRGAGAIVVGIALDSRVRHGGPSFDLPWPPARNSVEYRPSSRRFVVGLGLWRSAGLFPWRGQRPRQRAQSGELLCISA